MSPEVCRKRVRNVVGAGAGAEVGDGRGDVIASVFRKLLSVLSVLSLVFSLPLFQQGRGRECELDNETLLEEGKER